MQYLVSIENCQFFRWQLELLHESMSLLGVEDSLVIACAHFENKKLRFPNVFYHENVGRKFNYLALNKPYALQVAVKNNLIKQPFVLIDPDMFMLRPIDESNKCSANYYNYLEFEFLTKLGYLIKKEKWRPGGVVYHINNCDNYLLESIFNQLYYEFMNIKLPRDVDYWQREMVSFAIFLSKVDAEIRQDYVSLLDHRIIKTENCNFVHYSNGFHPYFDKNLHNNLRNSGEPLPFESILKIPEENENIIKFKNITKSYLSRNNQKFL